MTDGISPAMLRGMKALKHAQEHGYAPELYAKPLAMPTLEALKRRDLMSYSIVSTNGPVVAQLTAAGDAVLAAEIAKEAAAA